MKETLESSPVELALQDKKRTSIETDANSMIANNSNKDCITSDAEKQSRISEAAKFFNLLFGRIPAEHFSYLMIFTNGYGITYSFAVTDQNQREAMARKAVELSELGNDVWHAVNPVNVSPTGGKRGDETAVSYQTAVVVDIDICSNAHKSNNLAANFEEAKSFLPFAPSIIINSGYGLHAYYIWTEPIAVTNDNREEIKRRNNLLLDVVRQRANGKKIDGVGDLPRILRTPATFNYKLGAENPPLCHIVENSGLRFSPTELDEKLNALTPAQSTSTPAKFNEDFVEDRDFNFFRIRRMLDFISPSSLTYDEWLAVGMALKNSGFDCSDWENWSRADDRFKDGECESKWNGFNRDGYDIGTMYHFAEQGGYDAQEAFREWHELHPKQSKISAEKNTDDDSNSKMASLKAQLLEANKAIANFDTEKDKALEMLQAVTVFDSDTVFADKIVTAGAFAKLFDKQAYSNFKREIKLFGDKHRDKKATVNDWVAAVRDKADLISFRRSDLITQRNEIQAQIKSLAFVDADDTLEGIVFPPDYSISSDGISKVAGEGFIPVCRRPVIITGKSFSVDEKIYKLTLAFMTQGGKWKRLPPTEKAIIFNKNKLVDLANADLPVTTSNATHLVDYLDAFNALNESSLPLTYNVSRCGWQNFEGKDCFVDPRREFSVTAEDKNIRVKVDDVRSDFARHLKQVGSLKAWKKIYKLAKKSPVARLIVAAAIAPILLKVLGERNFLLYIYAPTRAGKTTALYLGASAVGDERIIRTFDATKNGLAGAAADVNDYPFLIDEKQVADNRLADTFANLIYALANGIGRTKLNRDSSLKKLQDWRTIAIMTGETLLLPDNVTGGANTRLLTIKAPKVILPADICKIIHDTIPDNYGLALPLVVDKVLEFGRDKLRGVFEEIIDTFTARYPELLPEYRRYMAVLTLADTLLTCALFGNTVTTEDGKTIKAIDDAIQNAVKIFPLIPTTAEISDTARGKDFVRGIIAQNQNHFIGGNIEDSKIQGIWGKLDDADGYYYITVQALKDACKRYERDYRKLVADLVADGFFIPSNRTKKGCKKPLDTVQKKIGKTNAECYRIPRTVFDSEE